MLVFATLLFIIHALRWIIIPIITLFVMLSGGFLAGLGAGFLTWVLLKIMYILIFVLFGYKILADNQKDSPNESP